MWQLSGDLYYLYQLSMHKIGQKICVSNKRYEVCDYVGKGQESLVYKVRDQKNKYYAVKHMLKYKDGRVKQLFQNEKKYYQQLIGVKQVVQYIDSEAQYLVLQLGDYSLSYWVQNNNKMEMNQKILINIVIDIIKGLKAIHKKNIIHRDIKPDNIIKFNDNYKILDFGVSTKMQHDNNLLGTIKYWPPQVLQNHQFTIKADTWSLGVTIFQLYFNINPFYLLNSNTTAHETIKQLLTNIKQLTPKFEIKKFLACLTSKKMTKQYNQVCDKIKQIDRQLLDYICSLFEPDPVLRWEIDYSLIFFQKCKKKIGQQSFGKNSVFNTHSTIDQDLSQKNQKNQKYSIKFSNF